MNKEYLLSSNRAKELYEFSKQLPIIDYHNHLSVSDIACNKRFDNIYDLWIKPDPYKHRAMRMCGVSEEYITGAASDIEKFKAWCEVFPKLVGNPLYVWSKMELESVFCITDIPNKENAESIYEKANLYLKENEVTAKSLLERFNVEFACPCVSLADDVSFFEDEKNLAPSLRGDDVTFPDHSFIKKLLAGIKDLLDYKKAVINKLEELKKVGCRFSDHALDNGFRFFEDDGGNEKRFEKLLCGQKLCGEDKARFCSYMLTFLCNEYSRLGFTLQLHIGAQRSTSTRLRTLAGAAGGYAAAGSCVDVTALTTLLDSAEKGEYGLPRILLFTLNPADNAVMATLCGSYSKDGEEAFVSQGPAWWWCDHYQGICDMLDNFMCHSVLSSFIGMTTDSRSLLSFVRHDYFRRVLCEWISDKVSKNRLPEDFNLLADTVSRICYKNAKRLLGGN